jgi:hypothetical protein
MTDRSVRCIAGLQSKNGTAFGIPCEDSQLATIE